MKPGFPYYHLNQEVKEVSLEPQWWQPSCPFPVTMADGPASKVETTRKHDRKGDGKKKAVPMVKMVIFMLCVFTTT